MVTLDQLLIKNHSSCKVDNTIENVLHPFSFQMDSSISRHKILHSSNAGFDSTKDNASWHKSAHGKYGIGCLWQMVQDSPTDIEDTPISDSSNINSQFPNMCFQFKTYNSKK